MKTEAILARAIANPSHALRLLDKYESEQSLYRYIQLAWAAIEPGKPFVPGKAVQAMCEHLEAVSSGQIKRLLINIPPGCTKSMTVSVMWPTWEWGPRNLPHLRYINASYNVDLPIRDNIRARDLMNSEWYQDKWGDRFKFKSDQNAKIRYENSKHGWRFACGVGAGLTGHRGDRILLDDPHSIGGAESEAERENTLRWFGETLPTRLNDMDESVIVVIMQRVHQRDVSGLILAKELGYEHLMLPMEFEPDHPHVSKTSLNFKDWRTTPGELLWPERFSAKGIEALKNDLRSWGGTYAEAGQLQQRPSPRGGGMFQHKDFQYVDSLPTGLRFVRGWDLAATKGGHGAWSVGVKIGIAPDKRLFVADIRRLRGSPFEVEEAIQQCARADGPSVCQSLPQDPGQAGKAQKSHIALKLHGHDIHFSPETGSKEDRARPVAAQAEAGNLFVLRAPWNDTFVNEACMFPNGEFVDQVDALSRAYAKLIVRRDQLIGVAPTVV